MAVYRNVLRERSGRSVALGGSSGGGNMCMVTVQHAIRDGIDVPGALYLGAPGAFVEYWDRIVIDSYTIALLTAILLEVTLKATLAIEHRIAAFFRQRSGPGAMALRLLVARPSGDDFCSLDVLLPP